MSVVLVGAACGGGSGPSPADEVASMCNAIRDLHNEIIDVANDMAARELSATPEQRAQVLVDGLVEMTEIVGTADLPAAPQPLVAELERGRATVVAEMETNAATFRTEWPTVELDERAAAVPQIFVWLEKLQALTQPRITSDTPAGLIDAARAESACVHVVDGLR